MTQNRMWYLALLLCTPLCLKAASLPTGLNRLEVERVVASLGQASATKVLRSAESYDKLFPGIKIGFEINMLAGGDLGSLGNGDGTVPGLLPMPRFYLAKSLPFNAELILSFFPTNLLNTINGLGGILKWNFKQEKSDQFSAAAYLGHSSFGGFDSTFEGYSWEAGALVSRDYVRYRPYIGMGVLMAHGTVPASHALDINSAWQSTIHTFVGLEYITTLVLTGQIDFMNLSPRLSLMVGQKF